MSNPDQPHRDGVVAEDRAADVLAIQDLGTAYAHAVDDGDRWRFARRVEHTTYMTGGGFAAMIREAAAGEGDGPVPFG